MADDFVTSLKEASKGKIKTGISLFLHWEMRSRSLGLGITNRKVGMGLAFVQKSAIKSWSVSLSAS